MTLSLSITRRVLFSIVALLLAFTAVIVSKESGWTGTTASKSAVTAVLGLMMVVMGNLLPKLSVPGISSRARRSERFAGLSLMIGGLALIPTTLLFPAPWAPSAAAVVGLAAHLAATVLWFQAQSKHPPVVDDRRTSLRTAFGHLLLAITWVLAMFPADLLWGNSSKWPMLIGYMLSSFALITWRQKPGVVEAPPQT
jgi:hypothetical protein